MADQAKQKRLLMGLGGAILLAAGIYYFLLAGPAGPTIRPTYPVEGTVLFQGKPAVGAQVSLYAEDAGKDYFAPVGTVEADGTFKLTTYNKEDGAPAGRYKVAIRWDFARGQSGQWATQSGPMKFGASKSGQAAIDEKKTGAAPVDSGIPPEVANVLEKYSHPDTSGLTADVKTETTKLTYDLK